MVLIGAGTFLMIEKNGTQRNRKRETRLDVLCGSFRRLCPADHHPGKNRHRTHRFQPGYGDPNHLRAAHGLDHRIHPRETKGIRQIDTKSWFFLIFSGVATGLSWLCYYRALQTGQASLVAPIDKLVSCLLWRFSWLFLKGKAHLEICRRVGTYWQAPCFCLFLVSQSDCKLPKEDRKRQDSFPISSSVSHTLSPQSRYPTQPADLPPQEVKILLSALCYWSEKSNNLQPL